MILQIKRKPDNWASILSGVDLKRSSILMLLVCLQCHLLLAQTPFYTNESYDFELIDASSRTLRITAGHNLSGEVRLPSRVNINGSDYTVTSINSDVIFNSQITELIVPENYLEIGGSPIGENQTITSVIFEDGEMPIIIPRRYDTAALLTKTPIQNAYIGRPIVNSPFVNSKLEKVEFGENITYIPESLFSGCKSLNSVKLSEGLKTIKSSAFGGCQSLIQLNLPEHLDSIESRAFQECSFVDFKLPQNLKYLGEYVFQSNYSLKKIALPPTISKIPKGTFYWCKSLENINIPETQDTIFTETFFRCTGFKTLELPSTVSVVEKKGLGSMYAEKLDIKSSANKLIFQYDAFYMSLFDTLSIHRPFIYPKSSFSSNHVIIGNVDSIPNGMFASTNLKSLVLEDGVRVIGESAFSHNPELETAIFPSTLEYIGKNAFWGCINNPKLVICNNPIPPYAKNSSVGNSTARLEVPRGSRRAYVASYGWTNFGTIWDGLPTKLTITPEKPTIKIGETLTFSVTYSPEEAEAPILIWSSSNPEIVEVDDSGKILGKTKGKATITAYSKEDPDLKVSIPVSVEYNPITSIIVSPKESTIHVGDSIQLNVIVQPEEALTTPLTWRSYGGLNVNQNGLVTTSSFTGEGQVVVSSSIDSAVADTCYIKIIEPLVKTIEVSPEELTFELFSNKSSKKISVTITPSNANKKVRWVSSDTDVVEVDENGNVKPIGLGDAIVTAYTTDESNLKSECKVSVKPTLVSSVKIGPDMAEMKIGETSTLKVIVDPYNAYDRSLEWSVSDGNVVSVDEEGLITALSLGETVVIATAKDGSEKSDSCKIIVVPQLADKLELNPKEWSGNPNEEFQISAVVLPEATTDKTLRWKSSSPKVAEVNEYGYVRTLSVGSAMITASTVDGSYISESCMVIVNPVKIEKIEIDPSEWIGTAPDSFKLSVSVFPEDATNQDIAWISDNESVATVDSDGWVTVKSPGETYIKAMASDGSDCTAECHVIVENVLVESISLTPDSWEGEEGSHFRIDATVLPENATDKSLLWSSTDVNVAKVYDDGYVDVRMNGSCEIIARSNDGSNVYATCYISSKAGLDTLFSDDDIFDIYLLNGVLVRKAANKEDLKLLAPDIYIIRQGMDSKRIVIF